MRHAVIVAATLLVFGCRSVRTLDTVEQHHARTAAEELLLKGQTSDAIAVLDQSIQHTGHTSDARQELNAALLHLNAQIRFANAHTDAERRTAEALSAWAINENPNRLDYWQLYTRIRLASVGYSTLLTEYARGTQWKYFDTVFPHRHGCTITFPAQEDLSLLKAILQAETGNLQNALKELPPGEIPGEAFISAPEEELCIHIRLRIELLTRQQEYATAQEYLDELMEGCPDWQRDPGAHLLQGRIARAQNSLPRARQAFEEAVKLDTFSSVARRELATTLLINQPHDARTRALLTDALRRDPRDWTNWSVLWQTSYYGTDRIDEYTELTYNLQAGENGSALLARALPVLLRGDFDKARTSIQRAMACDNAPLETHLASALLHLIDGELQEADKVFRNIVAAEPPVRALLDKAALAQFMTEYQGKIPPATAIGPILVRLADSLQTSVAQTTAEGYLVHTTGQPGGLQTAVQILGHERIGWGRIADEVFTRVRTVEEATARLTEQGNALLARLAYQDDRMGAMEREQRREWGIVAAELDRLSRENRDQDRRIQLTTAQINTLNAHVRAVNGQLRQLESTLSRRIAAGDRAVMQQINALVRQIEAAQGDVHAVRQQVARFNAASTPAAKAREAIKLSDIFSIGPSIGPVHINVIGAVEALASLLMG